MAQVLAGIGKKGRSQLAKLLKANLPTITPKNASIALKIDQHQASQLLADWSRKGWLSRVKYGVYIPVSLQADTTKVMADEPWVIAKAIYDPCYIGGWSAAEHWDLTEQIFNSTMVFTTKKTAKKNISMNGLKLTLKTIDQQRLFGTKNFWIGNQKVILSDPTKTIVDAFNSPEVVGCWRPALRDGLFIGESFTSVTLPALRSLGEEGSSSKGDTSSEKLCHGEHRRTIHNLEREQL